MNILLFLLIFAVVFAIVVIVITKIVNYIRGKQPVDYKYMLEKTKVFLDFPAFKSFYLATPENFNLRDETVYFNEDGYRGPNSSIRIGFKTLADLWAYQDWKENLDSKKESVENDEATLKFCQSMTRVLEKKKQAELKKAQNAAQDSINVINNLVKEERPLPPTTDSVLGR
jgi:hypothetical protein